MKNWKELENKIKNMKCGESIVFNHNSGIYKLIKTEDVKNVGDGKWRRLIKYKDLKR